WWNSGDLFGSLRAPQMIPPGGPAGARAGPLGGVPSGPRRQHQWLVRASGPTSVIPRGGRGRGREAVRPQREAVQPAHDLGAYLAFGDIEGKPDVLCVECTRCPRAGRYSVAKLIATHGRDFQYGGLVVQPETGLPTPQRGPVG